MTDFTFHNRLPETIETNRLLLKRPSATHIQSLARLANNAAIHQFMSRMPYPYGLEDARTFVETMARTETEHSFAICSRDEDFMGMCGLINRPEAVEIGYWLGQPYWGEGYMSEAAAALIAAAQTAGATHFMARANVTNLSSRRVLEKLGFKKTHEKTEDCGQHKSVPLAFYSLERDDGR